MTLGLFYSPLQWSSVSALKRKVVWQMSKKNCFSYKHMHFHHVGQKLLLWAPETSCQIFFYILVVWWDFLCLSSLTFCSLSALFFFLLNWVPSHSEQRWYSVTNYLTAKSFLKASLVWQKKQGCFLCFLHKVIVCHLLTCWGGGQSHVLSLYSLFTWK